MECDDAEYSGAVNLSVDEENRIAAVNSTILDYYKKFGRKRDLEQYFSLNTAQSEIRDPTSLFWRRMKSQNESSDSGERSSTELCRISIKCSVADPEPSCSQEDNTKTKTDSESPPIITEDLAHDTSKQSDDESVKSDDNHSQKSIDVTFDTSMNKAFSPTSSITSQRKLEWDSLADVGYANETDRKTSASSLSTLERLALLQQYSNNDTKNELGPPTAHSTPLDENESKPKGKKGGGKVTKIYRRDVDCVEVNVPHSSEMNPAQAINVNLTKHISFNVDGGVTIDDVRKEVSVTPEKVSVQTEVTPQIKSDKEIQTTLTKEKSSSSGEMLKPGQLYGKNVPVLINLNTLKKRNRRKVRTARKRVSCKNKIYANKENVPVLEKSVDQVSEAESFEYMPGHIYNQNQRNNEPRANTAGNKSSLESSGAITTDSSKNTIHSFTKDLEKSMKLLRAAMQKRCDDTDLKKRLVKEVVQRLLKSSYRDDASTTDFLSGLSFSSKKLGLGESNTTTSTSDANNTDNKPETIKPKKSILRIDKFNANAISSTSQSAPNLPSVSKSEKPVTSSLRKPSISSNTESDVSSREKNSSDTAFAKTSSEELYQKYIDALRREEAYKRHLRDKEMFLKQKLVSSESALKVPARLDVKSQARLKDLMKDLTRNNYDDGSGDASKLEGGPNMNTDFIRPPVFRNQRSQSVFTLSSGNSDCQSRKTNLKRNELKDSPIAGYSKDQKHYCCGPNHSKNAKIGLTDSSVQVNIEHGQETCKASCNKQIPVNIARVVSDDATGDIKYVCLCNNQIEDLQGQNDFLIYKCSRLTSKGIQSQESRSNTISVQCKHPACPRKNAGLSTCLRMEHKNLGGIPEICSKSSQTNIASQISCICNSNEKDTDNAVVHEAVRCLQTEISINPRISDPSLSDINIVSDADCAKFIREQYRVVSKSSSQSDATNQEQNNGPLCMSTKVSEENFNKGDCGSTVGDPPDIEDKFRIPIQGTNMTVMVSVGSNAVKPGIEMPKNELINKAVVTDAINTNENSTCLRDECSKGIQFRNEMDDRNTELSSPRDNQFKNPSLVNTLFTRLEFYNSIYTGDDIKINNDNQDYSATDKGCGVQTELVETFFATQSQIKDCQTKPQDKQVSECNTYPKIRFVEKPLLRSDTGNVENILTSRFNPGKSKCSCLEPARCNFSSGDNQRSIACNIERTKTNSCDSRDRSPKKKFICSCPETSRCKGNCGLGFDSANQRSFIRSDSDRKNKKSGDDSQSARKNKCSCPKTARCKGNCGPDFDCANQRPFPRSDSGRDNKKSSDDSCGSRGETTKIKNKCVCPETARCKGNCGPDFDCVNQMPFPRSDSDRDNKKSGDDSCGSRGETTKIKNKCMCPETARCKGNCGPDFDCVNQRPFPRSDSDRDIKKSGDDSCGSRGETTKTQNKCRCPETARCKGNCGPDFDCVNQRPFPRSDSDRNNKKSGDDSCGSRGETTKIKNKCMCPETARCKGNCGPDFDCVNQMPFPRSDSDRDNKKSGDDSSGSSGETTKIKNKCSCPETARCKGNCGPDCDCVKQRPFPRSDSDRDNKKSGDDSCGSRGETSKIKNKCMCPETARCKGNCGPDFDCVNQRPFPRSDSDRDNKKSGDDSSGSRGETTKIKNKCSCPETARCKGNCGPDCDCVKQRPFPRSDSDRDNKKSGDDSCGSRGETTKIKNKCMCPETARCKGNCGPDFDCVNQRPFPRSDSDRDNKKSGYDSCGTRGETTKTQNKCRCPETARCKGNCSPDFDCVNQRLRNNIDRGDSEYNTQSDREIIDDTITKILKKKAKCGCPASAKCEGTCPERMIRLNTSKGKQCYIQTDYVEIENRETQKECNAGRSSSDEQTGSKIKHSSESDNRLASKDLILDMIQDITKRYSKKDIEKSQRKKCFNEIMTILKYLLDTEDSIDSDTIRALKNDCRSESDLDCNKVQEIYPCSQIERKDECNMWSGNEPSSSIYGYRQSTRPMKDKIKIIETPDVDSMCESKPKQTTECNKKVFVDKAVQLTKKTCKSNKICITESSDVPVSTDCHGTSSDSVTCNVLSKIKKECEKYHQKRCKCYYSSKKCEGSSSTSVNCDQCKRVHYCLCRTHRCKSYRPKSFVEKIKKKCVAYNLIIQTSESMISEETACQCTNKPLPNIIVKVPKRKNLENVPFKEVASKIERHIPCCSPRIDCRTHRSRSLPNESGPLSTDDCVQNPQEFTVRDYLQRNRPDFVEQSSKRQNSLKIIGERRANERASYRELLSLQLQLDGHPSLNSLRRSALRQLAREIGVDTRRKSVAPKFTSEREMKKHSEKIYKTLPEVVQKKEELKKEGIKKTNLLMANIFKKNLQRKALRGSVNLSNYNTILKI